VLANTETKQKVEDILTTQRERVAAVLEENRDVHTALVQALLERDELVRDDILEVIEKAIANRL
jgi:ATP-dependent Zn protease